MTQIQIKTDENNLQNEDEVVDEDDDYEELFESPVPKEEPKEEPKQEVAKETNEQTNINVAEVLDSLFTYKDVDYNEVHYKEKTYYLNKSTNIVFRKRKSGKVGKKYGTLNKDFTITKV